MRKNKLKFFCKIQNMIEYVEINAVPIMLMKLRNNYYFTDIDFFV